MNSSLTLTWQGRPPKRGNLKGNYNVIILFFDVRTRGRHNNVVTRARHNSLFFEFFLTEMKERGKPAWVESLWRELHVERPDLFVWDVKIELRMRIDIFVVWNLFVWDVWVASKRCNFYVVTWLRNYLLYGSLTTQRRASDVWQTTIWEILF